MTGVREGCSQPATHIGSICASEGLHLCPPTQQPGGHVALHPPSPGRPVSPLQVPCQLPQVQPERLCPRTASLTGQRGEKKVEGREQDEEEEGQRLT